MPRPAIERTVRQQEIVEVARQLFIEQGVEQVTMEDIAYAAALTRRTLYAYFKARDEVLLMVTVEDNQTRWALQQEKIKQFKTGLTKIRGWAESLYEFSKANPYTIELQVYRDFHGLNPESISADLFEQFEIINDEMATGLRKIFQLGVKDRSLRADLPLKMSIGHFLYSLRAIINRALSPHYAFAPIDPDRYVSEFIDLFIRAIKNPRRK